MALVSTHDSSASWTKLASFSRSVLYDQVPINRIDQLIGRKLSAPPVDLSRVLYIPRHDCNVTHLPLYDISAAYSKFVGSEHIGGSSYKVKLSLMSKPEGEGRHEVEYLVDFFDASRAVVERRCTGVDGSKANLQVSHLKYPMRDAANTWHFAPAFCLGKRMGPSPSKPGIQIL